MKWLTHPVTTFWLGVFAMWLAFQRETLVRRMTMGAVRDAVTEKPRPSAAGPTGPRGVTGDLVDIEERLYDLADKKTQDIAAEGEANRERNEASKVKLERAAALVKQAVDILRTY
jgi:hypothetical protein